jgi:hypothetical protein
MTTVIRSPRFTFSTDGRLLEESVIRYNDARGRNETWVNRNDSDRELGGIRVPAATFQNVPQAFTLKGTSSGAWTIERVFAGGNHFSSTSSMRPPQGCRWTICCPSGEHAD